ncbi:ATP-binding cassette domain-containing protein [Weissella viridescens]|uniref:ATP-binding cassette domain-containing protein n=1 Tax=Weissella viridescens TaxID=1629 RepID=A0A3P2RFP0_WEIVI|nr:ATP-binding cassette domain-containing protein [Weissella viridescens]RRG18071.1 ATP-binding cassette domain-containing protein [Weissella viridescens]
MLQVKEITVRNHREVLKHTSFNFECGKTYGVIADHGAGKTTLLRALSGQIQLQSGQVQLSGKFVQDKIDELFYCEGIHCFEPNQTGRAYVCRVQKYYHSAKRIDESLSVFHLDAIADRPIRSYTLQEKHRLLLTLYFASDANYLLLDELMNGLKDEDRHIFDRLIRHWQREGKTLILTGHRTETLAPMCHQLLTIYQKQLIAQ